VRKRAGELIVQGELRGKPLSRFTVEVFGNRAAGSGEGEIFLGHVAATSDAEGRGKFSLAIDAAKLAAMPASFTATLTSADGATSEFSQPVALSE
jgi:3-dehydroshikimate dehydratase